jgi:alpha,alpha-trehalase
MMLLSTPNSLVSSKEQQRRQKLSFGLSQNVPLNSPLVNAPDTSSPKEDTFSPTLSQGIQAEAPIKHSPAGPVLPPEFVKAMAGRQLLYPVDPVLKYIKAQWGNLLITNRQLLDVMKDPKVQLAPNTAGILYISEKEDPKRVYQELRHSLTPQDLSKVQIKTLPPPGPARNDLEPGLLYLPHPYVVPGGRFKEMYGWDSYFIQLGLLKDKQLGTAKDMADNLLYEINNYGTILNANRSYFVNRSQPPFITEMVLNVYNKTHDKEWLKQALGPIENHYKYWTSNEHLIPNGPAAGLSRYYAFGNGPAKEVAEGEIENGKNHYDRIQDYYRTHKVTDYDVKDYMDPATGKLTPLFYKGDQTMRESGFDPSNRFGQFNVDVINYAPVCLNSLLYKMEKDMSEIYKTLDKPDRAAEMDKLSQERKTRMNQALWDEKTGMYEDFNIKTNQRRFYPYATMFFPLWAGVASPEQAAKTMKNLPRLEAPGGLMTSAFHSGNQWDAPFAWAPLQLVAVKGLLNYDNVPEAHDAAIRLSNKFVNQVAKAFSEHGGIFEKYNVQTMKSDVSEGIDYGYSSNELGFGWTNGTFLELLDVLKKNAKLKPSASPPSRPPLSDITNKQQQQQTTNPFAA